MAAWFRRLCCKIGIHVWKPVFRYYSGIKDPMMVSFVHGMVALDHLECRHCGKRRE